MSDLVGDPEEQFPRVGAQIGHGAYRAIVPGIYKACTANLDPIGNAEECIPHYSLLTHI